MNGSRIPENEIVPRGEKTNEREIRPKLDSEHEGKFVVVDVESGDYEVSADDEEASERIEERRPDGIFFVLLAGPNGKSQPAYRTGASGL